MDRSSSSIILHFFHLTSPMGQSLTTHSSDIFQDIIRFGFGPLLIESAEMLFPRP